MAGRFRARRPRTTIVLTAAMVSLLVGFALGVFGFGQAMFPSIGQQATSPEPETISMGTRSAGTDGARPGGRGLWVVRHALRTPEAIDAVIATASDVGADTLFVQVNGRMEAYYRSALLPPAPDMIPDFDPLDYVIRRARAAGMQVHAWINAFTAGMLAERPTDPRHVLNRRPDWVTVDRGGRSLWDYGWEEAQIHVPARMLDPGVPAVQQFVLDVVLEVVDTYAVDGIHLDYVRYPSRRFGYHPDSLARFVEEHGFDPMALERDAVSFVAAHGREEFQRRLDLWDDWRRAQVTSLVERIGRAVASRGGQNVFSVAVGADAGDAFTERLQSWPAWVERGLVDALFVMAYSADTARVAEQVQHAVSLGKAAGVPVYAGLGVYLLNGDTDLLRRQLDVAQSAGAAGIAVFSYDTLLEQAHFRTALRAAW